MTDKQINKWLRKRFTALGWVLVGYYVLMNVMVLLSTWLDAAGQTLQALTVGDHSGALDLDAIAGNAWGYIITIVAGFAILYAWKGPDYWWRDVWQKERKMKGGVLFSCISLLIGTQMVNSLWVTALEVVMNAFGGSLMPMLETVSGAADTFSMFLYSAIFAPVAEELLFRGYILRSLRPYGKRFAVFGSAVLFGLFHGNLLQTPYAILVGLLLGYVTVEYSLAWAVGLHMFNNLVLADFLTRLTASWSEMAYGTLNLILFGGSAVLSLVILFRKRGEIRAYRKAEWIDRRCLKCLFTNAGILALAAVMCAGMITMFFA